jgi:ribosomal-protein-alanine N-acetyltransferase
MPLPVIGTERLVLRPWTLADVDALHSLWTAPEVRQYLWDDIVITRDSAEQLVKSHLATAAHDDIGFWALLGPPTAGFCGFRYIDDGPDIELLYGLRSEHWGKGFATEACLAAIEYLWQSTRFRRVFARTDPPNERSVRVMQRLGMILEATNERLITYVLQRTA